MKTLISCTVTFCVGALLVWSMARVPSTREVIFPDRTVLSAPGECSTKDELRSVSVDSVQPKNSAQDRQSNDVQKTLDRLDQSRKDILSSLLPSGVRVWERLRTEKVDIFLHTTDRFWSNGKGDLQSRFDRGIAERCLGEYEGQIEYQVSGMREPAVYNLKLKLATMRPEENTNSIQMKSNRFGSFSTDFSADYLGTDSKTGSLSVVWYNFNTSERSATSHFAFYIRPGALVGDTMREELYGLDEGLNFHRIGTVTLRKNR